MFYNYILRKGLFKGGYWLLSGAFVLACLLVFLFFSLFFNLAPALALDDGCYNVANWRTSRAVADFNDETLTPNLWPDHVFTLSESINTYYEFDIGLDLEPRTVCASYLCDRPASSLITVADTLDPAICSCTGFPGPLCADRKWQNPNYPSIEASSNPVGEPMPDFPEPIYPIEWDTKKMYTGITQLAPEDFPAFLISKLNQGLNVATATVQDCNDISLIGNEATAATVRRYVINNVRTVKQEFEMFFNPFQTGDINYGVCGVYNWNYTEGNHLIRTGGYEVITIPVEAVFPVSTEEETPAQLGCPQGTLKLDGVTCANIVSANNEADCPSGWYWVYGPFGSSTCRNDSDTLAAYCTSGVLLEDTSTTPSTFTCLDGSFSTPDPPPINISGAESAPPDPTPGDFDGTVDLQLNGADDPQADITLTITPDGGNPDPTENIPPPDNPPDPTTGSDPATNPNTRGVLNMDGVGVGGGFQCYRGWGPVPIYIVMLLSMRLILPGSIPVVGSVTIARAQLAY